MQDNKDTLFFEIDISGTNDVSNIHQMEIKFYERMGEQIKR